MWARTNCLLLLANAGLLLGPTHQECGGVLFSNTTHGTVQYFLPLSDSINGARCSWILPDNAEAIQLEVVSQQTVSWADVGCNSAYLEIKLEATENEREFCGLFWSVPKGGRKLVIRGQGPGIIVLETPASGFEHGLTLRYLGKLGKGIDSNAPETLTAIPVLSLAQGKEDVSRHEGLTESSASMGQMQRVSPGNNASEQTSRGPAWIHHPSQISESPNLLLHPILGNLSHPDSGSSPAVRGAQTEPSPKSTEGLSSSGESTASVNSISTLYATFNPPPMHSSSAELYPTSSDQRNSASISRSGSVSRHHPSSLTEPQYPATILSSEYVSTSGQPSLPSANSTSRSSMVLRPSIRSFVFSPKVDAGQSLAPSLAPSADPRAENLDGVMIQSTDRVGRPSAPDSESRKEPRLPFNWMVGRSRLTTAQRDVGSTSDVEERPGRTWSDCPKPHPTTSRPPKTGLSRETDQAPSSQSVGKISLATSSDLRISQRGGGQQRNSQWMPPPPLEDRFSDRLLPRSQTPRLLVTSPTPIRDPSLHTSSLSSEGQATVSLDFDYVSGIERTGDPEPIQRQEFPATSSPPITPSEQRGGQSSSGRHTAFLAQTSRIPALSARDANSQYLSSYPPQTSALVTHFEGMQRKYQDKDISSTAAHTVTKAGPWNVFDIRKLMSRSSKPRMQGVSNGNKTDAEGLSRVSCPDPSPQPAGMPSAVPALSNGETTRTAPSRSAGTDGRASATPSASSPSFGLAKLANAEGSGHEVDSGDWMKTGDGWLTDGDTTVEVDENTHTPAQRLAVTPSVKPNLGLLDTSTLSGQKDRSRSETTGGSSTGSALRAELLGEALRLEGGSSSPSNSDQENSAESPPMITVVPVARILSTVSPEPTLSQPPANANLQPTEVDSSEIPASEMDHHTKERLSTAPTTTWFPWRSSVLLNSRPPTQITLSRAWSLGGKATSPAETSASAKSQEMTEVGQSGFAPNTREFSERVQPGTEFQPTVTNWTQSQLGLQTTSQPPIERRGAISRQTAGSSFPVWSEELTPPTTINFKVNHLKPSSEQGPMTSEEPVISWTDQLRPVTKDLSLKPHVISTEDLDALPTQPAGPWLSEQWLRNISPTGTNPTTSTTEIDLVTVTSGPERPTSLSSALVMAEFVTTHRTPSTSALSNDISRAWNTDISQTQSTDVSQSQNPDVSQTQSTDVSQTQNPDVSQTQSTDVSQTQSTDVSQSQNTDISQTQSTEVSQSQNPDVSQTQSTDVSQTQSTDTSQTQSTDIGQTWSMDTGWKLSTIVSQIPNTDISLALSWTRSPNNSWTRSPDISRTPGPVVSQTRGPVVSQTQGPVVSQTQGPVVSQTQGPVVSHTRGPGIRQTGGSVVSHTRGPGIRQTRGPGIRQTRGPVVSQTRGPGIRQTWGPGIRQTRGPGIRQTRGPVVSQTRGPGIRQTWDPDIRQTRDPDIRQTRDPDIRQTWSPDIRQTQGRVVSQTWGPDTRQTPGPVNGQTRGPVVSQTWGPDIRQTREPDIRQTGGPEISQTLGPDVRQTQGEGISWTLGPEVSQTQGQDVSWTHGLDISQTRSTDINWTLSPVVSQTQTKGISLTVNSDISQMWDTNGSQKWETSINWTQGTDVSQTGTTGVTGSLDLVSGWTGDPGVSQTWSAGTTRMLNPFFSGTLSPGHTRSAGVSQSPGPDVSQTQSEGISQTQGPDVSWTLGPDISQTQSEGISQTQGPDVSQTLGPDISQTQGPDVSWTLGPDISQTQGEGISQTLGEGISQTQGPDVSRTLGPDISQTQDEGISQTQGEGISQTQGEGISQTLCPDVSQTLGPDISQTQDEGISQTQGEGISQTQGEGISQTLSEGISQTQGGGISQTLSEGISQTQGEGISQTLGPDVSQTLGPDISQTQDEGISQTQGEGISQTQGEGISQTLGPDVSQTLGPDISQTQDEGISQTQGEGISQTQGEGISQTLGPDVSQTLGPDISQTQDEGISQTQGEGISQTQGEGISQTLSEGISQTQGEGISQTLGPDVSQTLGPDISQSQDEGISQTQGEGISQTQGPDVSQTLGPDISQTQDEGISQTQGEGISQTLSEGISQTQGEGISQTQDEGISQTQGEGISQTQGEGISQTQGPDVSQTLGPDISQTQDEGISQTQGEGISQTQGPDVSQTLGPDISQTQDEGISQTQGEGISQTQGPDVSQTLGPDISQTQDEGISQTQGEGISQTQGEGISQTQGPDVSQTLGPDISQTQDEGISQTQGEGISQTQGPDVSQTLGPDISQTQDEGISQTQGEGISQTLGPDVSQTLGPDISQTQDEGISQTQGEGISQTQGEGISQTQSPNISQTWSTDVSQLQNTDIIQTLSLKVSQSQGTDISRTLGPVISQTRGTDVSRARGLDIRRTQGTDISQTLGLEVSQTQGMDISRTGGLEVNHTWSRFGTAVSLPTPSTGSVALPLPTSRPSTDSPVRPTSTAAGRETGRTVQSTSQQLPPGTRRAAGNTVSLSTPSVGRKQIFIVEDQLPLVREGATVKIPTKLILDMSFNLHLKDSKSDEYQKLAKDFALKISPFYDTIPGFQQLQIKRFSAGSVKIEFDAIFRLTKIESFLLDPDLIFNVSGLWLVISGGFEIGGARVVTVYVTEKVIALCGEVLFCQNGFQCVHGKSGNVSCTSLCHTAYCKNSGICIHNWGQAPICQCPVGSDYWFMGPRCDHRMTNQILVAIAFGVVLALLVVLAAVAFLVLRRFKVVLTEAKIDQTRSSYKRFSRFDDFSNQHQSQSWLSFSVNSLDNPGFSNSDELIHLQILDTSFYSCYEESVTGTYSSQRTGPHGQPAFRHSLQNLDASINSINEYMGDSGKASDMSVCSWPGEPFRWSPFPILYQLGRERPFKARRPHSYYEGMELVSMERNWTA